MNPGDLFARYVGDVACVCFTGFTHNQIQKPWGSRRGYPPVNSEFANWKIAHFEEVNQRTKWQCSIALLNYQRVCHISICQTCACYLNMFSDHRRWVDNLRHQPWLLFDGDDGVRFGPATQFTLKISQISASIWAPQVSHSQGAHPQVTSTPIPEVHTRLEDIINNHFEPRTR